MATVYGNDNSNTITWWSGVTNGDDSIYGLGGNDSIYGLGGNDTIKGGGGADYINGGSGNDTAGYFDSATGVTVSLATGLGYGGTAEGDTLTGIENLMGSQHADVLTGNDGANTLTGFGGDDILKGGGGADTLYGDAGNDTLKGGGGADTLNGGSGIDTASYTESGAGVTISLITDSAHGGDATGDDLNGIENLTGSAYADTLIGDNGANALNGMNGNDTLKGYGGADTLLGGDGNDSLYGMEGIDYLRGDNGNDVLDGGAGNDTMIGGLGNDTYYVDSAGDIVTETGAGTIDTVYTSASFTLTAGANVEIFRTTSDSGTSNINLTGNESNQQIIGNNGANEIAGGLGNDTLTGNGGNDTFIFSSALDGQYNVDTITDFNQANDFIALDNAVFSTITSQSGHYLTGNEFFVGTAAHDADDRIIYNAATGALLYDADGNGAGAAVQFAEVAPGMNLVNDDFIIV